MALKLPSLQDTIEVVVSADAALNMTDKEYEAYVQTLDPALLICKEGETPTKFVLRKVLPLKFSQKIQQHIKYKPMGKGADDNPVSVDFLAYIAEEIRYALIDIINPPNCPVDSLIEFKKGTDGGAHDDLISVLYEVGAVMDLFNARQNATKKQPANNPDAIKKK